MKCYWVRLATPWLAALMLMTACASSPRGASFNEQVYQGQENPLADATILIIRHAEKPELGSGLSEEGEARARAYVGYFKNLRIDSEPVHVDYLVAADDSEHSQRSRLTLEPLGQALGLKPDLRFQAKRPAPLARELRTRSHGKTALICWHHREIPDLLKELGADPEKLLPKGEWPAQQFSWVLVLRYDHEGNLVSNRTKGIKERLMPGD